MQGIPAKSLVVAAQPLLIHEPQPLCLNFSGKLKGLGSKMLKS